MIKMVKRDLDEIDFRIAYELQKDCRISYKQLGNIISLSSSSVYERTKRMEDKDVILSYNAKVDWGKFGYSIHAFILLKDDKLIGDLPYFLRNRDEVFNLYMVSGEYDYLLEVYIANNEDLGNFMDYLYKEVGRTYTLLILREVNGNPADE